MNDRRRDFQKGGRVEAGLEGRKDVRMDEWTDGWKEGKKRVKNG